MRGKKAKQLRRQAEQQTQGQPTCQYKHEEGRHEIRRGYVRERIGMPAILVPGCTRAVYQRLKREAKQA